MAFFFSLCGHCSHFAVVLDVLLLHVRCDVQAVMLAIEGLGQERLPTGLFEENRLHRLRSIAAVIARRFGIPCRVRTQLTTLHGRGMRERQVPGLSLSINSLTECLLSLVVTRFVNVLLLDCTGI